MLSVKQAATKLNVSRTGGGTAAVGVSVKQTATKLNVSPSTVYTLVESGAMPHHRIGRAIRISEEQLVEYLEGQKKEGAAKQAAPVSKPRRKKKTYSHISLN